mmetsp:Transcript_11181/g.35339  ORF Transcript_11181/g.35339 Transcript_11181/m.35339 type:complete len:200 (-) Transcript_11181:2266-2865(-)
MKKQAARRLEELRSLGRCGEAGRGHRPQDNREFGGLELLRRALEERGGSNAQWAENGGQAHLRGRGARGVHEGYTRGTQGVQRYSCEWRRGPPARWRSPSSSWRAIARSAFRTADRQPPGCRAWSAAAPRLPRWYQTPRRGSPWPVARTSGGGVASRSRPRSIALRSPSSARRAAAQRRQSAAGSSRPNAGAPRLGCRA